MLKYTILILLSVALIYALKVHNGQTPQPQDPWYTYLPDCPCTNPDQPTIKLGDGWAKDRGDIATYHRGAVECFRSYPYVKTPAGRSGQQCCYDQNGLLIRSGSGAGTPDKVSTCSGEDSDGVMELRVWGILGHYFKDVRPWQKAGTPADAWKNYNQEWVPGRGDCE